MHSMDADGNHSQNLHVSVDVNETVDYLTYRFSRRCSMNVESHEDCNVVSKRIAATEHVTWMLSFDQVDRSAV